MKLRRTSAWLVIAAGLGSCSSPGTQARDPIADFQNPKLTVPRRIEALDNAWSTTPADSRMQVRETLKATVWSDQTPAPLRLATLHVLLDDRDHEADSRQLAVLMIGLEPDPDVVRLLADTAAARGWTEATPPLVRRYARVELIPDSERPERKALLTLNPGRTIDEIAFEVFLHPVASGQDAGTEAPRRLRAAAWNLLGRLDPDGSTRAVLLGSAATSGDPVLADLQACLKDLRTVPITGDELGWLQALRDPTDQESADWWAQASSAVAKLSPEQAHNLRLRHAEAVRWAASSRPEWVAADRAALLSEVSSRLKGRHIHLRSVRADVSVRPPSERLPEVADRLSWGDLLTILAIDEAVHDRAVISEVFSQVQIDRKDKTTEHGGLLFLPPRGNRAMAYPPRPGERIGDDRFIASADMIAQSDLAAAHYHFHVRDVFNSAYSGPSDGDLSYATAYGRACVVFTSLSDSSLSVDYYQPDWVVLDLGEVHDPSR